MFILAFFLVISISQYISNLMLGIDSSSDSAFDLEKRDSYIIGSLMVLAIFLQIISKLVCSFFWILVLVYIIISMVTVMIVILSMQERVKKQMEEVSSIYPIFQKLTGRKGNIDFNDVPFKLGYKYGSINKIDVQVEPSNFDDKSMGSIISQLNNFLNTYTWGYELHLEARYISFIGYDKPPQIARWAGGWLRPPKLFPMGISGEGEVCWRPDSIDKNIIGRSLFEDEYNKPIEADLKLHVVPQGLVCGGTNGGKSVTVQNVLIHSIENNDQIKLALVDPKIVEFENYKGMKGVLGVANNVKESVEILRIARAVMLKRNKELAKLGCKKVSEYTPTDYSGKVFICGREFEDSDNIEVMIDDVKETKKAGELADFVQSIMKEIKICLNDNDWIVANHNCIRKIYNDSFPMLLVVVDEMSELTLKGGLKSPEEKEKDAYKDEIVSILTSIAQLGRSAAVHVIVCTQKPKAEVVPTTLRANLGLRIFMGTASESASSTVALDSTLATTIDSTYPGMGIIQADAIPTFFRSYFSKFSDLQDYYSKRGLDELGYSPNENKEIPTSTDTLSDEEIEIEIDKTKVKYEFEDESVEIDKRAEQEWTEV